MEQKIPTQLKDQVFCRVRKGEKTPFEKNWNVIIYTYEQIQSYFPKENYGVLTGVNQLGVLDDDTTDKILMKLFEDNFGKSFRVRNHYYIYLKGWNEKKIIFYDKDGKHMGELQGFGQQVVGCGSLHPSGETYELKEDLPIKEIEYEEFKNIFIKYIPKEKQHIKNITNINNSWSGDNIKDIPISRIINISELYDCSNGCYQGSHPYHSSTTGMNFRIDTNKNVWYCYRCNTGGGPSELIGVMEGIINCSSAGSNCYSKEQAQEVIKVAREKYGLTKPLIKYDRDPQGWALSINIKTMAERNKFIKCPKCNKNFEFNENLGFFKCNSCGLYGGIKLFTELIHNSKKEFSEVLI